MPHPMEQDRSPMAADGAVPHPADVTITALFERQSRATPEAIAVVCDDQTLTYGQLAEWSDRFAAGLIDRGVGPEAAVAVALPRSAELVAVLLGVLKAGAAYLPMDPDYPAERMEFMLRDVRPTLRIGTDRAPGEPYGPCPVVTPAEITVGGGMPGTHRAPRPEQLAYVIYTSGSTGTPKGIGITHRDVVDLASDSRFAGGAHTCVLLHSPLAFDASVYELWVPLLTGGRVVVDTSEDLTPGVLADLVSRNGVTAVWLTSALFNVLVEDDPHCLAGLREVWAAATGCWHPSSGGPCRRARTPGSSTATGRPRPRCSQPATGWSAHRISVRRYRSDVPWTPCGPMSSTSGCAPYARAHPASCTSPAADWPAAT